MIELESKLTKARGLFNKLKKTLSGEIHAKKQTVSSVFYSIRILMMLIQTVLSVKKKKIP